MDEFEWVKSFATSSYGTVSNALSHEPRETKDIQSTRSRISRGSFASFVCHVISLERKLRSFSPIVLDDASNVRVTGKVLGQGKTFMVRHAQWIRNPKEPPLDVALKEIIPDVQSSKGTSGTSLAPGSSHMTQSDWKDILFELRALLHEPIRYHPNLVRLLGIQWGLSPLSDSTYPVLIMEYASLGTFQTLQAFNEPLSFQTKQKLCYDVARALSALHASGIVHGDMKHENVLIFPNKNADIGISYTAKLADFGGTVMDMTADEFRKMETWTWPFQAPEITSDQRLTRPGMMCTDVYSFGLLVWRAFMDGQGFISLPGSAQNASDEDKRNLAARKATEEFTRTAVVELVEYGTARGIPQACIDIVLYTILHTVRLNPADRDLVKAQAALRGILPGHVPIYLRFVQEKNQEREATDARAAPGRHGITRDSLQFMLGRYGDDADLQDNLPGFRPRLDEPNAEEFLFDPETLKNILTWEQQKQMLDEMKDTATKLTSRTELLAMKPTVAAFHVFQCYLLEFGTAFDANDAVYWLLKASADDNSHEDADYYSQAWVWRISRSFEISINISDDRVESLLRLSVIRGHRTCLQDLLFLAASASEEAQQRWLAVYRQGRHILLSQMGAVGMGYFFSSFMTALWGDINLNNVSQLDDTIRAVLGNNYESCLKTSATPPRSSSAQAKDKEKTAFDRIFVNRRGHGLLHYAAASGAVTALRHMITKYDCDINLPNQHVDETPLLCACEGGKLECALLLLEHGADPNGYRFSQESPLHWLASFLPAEMEAVARKLIEAGADIELRSGGMRHDVRGIRADWEHMLETRTTPLGRAVWMNNVDAVKVLLKLGANPLIKSANKHRGEWEGMDNISKMIDVSSPFDLAAVLTLPEILAEFVNNIDGSVGSPKSKLLDEAEMLVLAHSKKVTEFDPLSLQSRLVRCGANYKKDLRGTLTLLYARALPFHGYASDELQKKRSRVMCKEGALGNIDIVECLLDLGYSANGTSDHRPLQTAVETNHKDLFNLLMRRGADARVTSMTPTGNISLLHVCASRRRQCRPGSAIADALIAAGVPIESADVRSKSPLAMAVLNQNFDVARTLIAAGANVNAVYPLAFNTAGGLETRTVSVLVEILSQHTMRTLSSLQFLFGKREVGPTTRPAFYIDPRNKFSILHLLAGSPNFTHIAQITPKILNLCLETYADTELINYRHPLLGTALYYAAANGHKAMVERLVEKGADESANAGPDVDDSVQTLLRPKESWTPLWAAILRLDEELNKGVLFPPEGPPGAWLNSTFVQNLEKMIGWLGERVDDEVAKTAIARLEQKKRALKSEFLRAQQEKQDEAKDLGVMQEDKPIDLSVLSGKNGENDEKKIRELCEGPEQEWVTPEFSRLLEGLRVGHQ